MKRTNIYVLIVAMLLLCIALGMGALEEKDITHVQEPTEIQPTEEPTRIPLSKIQYEDDEYLRYTLDHSKIMLIYSDEIAMSANEADYEALEMSGIGLQTHSTRALKELKEFNISTSLKPFDNEYTLYIENMYLSGKHLEKGAKYLSIEDIKLSTNYVYKAASHLERATALLP